MANADIAQLAMEGDLDFWDLAFAGEQMRQGEERIDFRRDFRLDTFTEEQCVHHFRFKPDELRRLFNLLRLPQQVRSTHRVTAPGLEVLCIVLRRLAYPNRYADLQEFFSRQRNELLPLFHLGVNHILDNFSDRLSSFESPWLTVDKLMEYCEAIRNKGAALPLCWGFIDGTVRPMCRPGQNQRLVYNGHKKVHALKYQSVVAPNGLIVHLSGPIAERRHDAALLNESGLLAHMEQNYYAPDGRPLCLYGDAAYPLRPHLRRPHHPPLTPEQDAFNTNMSRVRGAVEWQFGTVVSLWAFLDLPKNLKLYLSPVAKLYRLGALLTNCHACINGNQTSKAFAVQPPTLEQYLS